MSITVSEKQFKNAAKRLQQNLSQHQGNLGYNQALQLLSQSLFSKTFEEIKATLFSESTEKDFVVILEYESESILTVNGNFVTQLNIGTESEISWKTLVSIGESLATEKGTALKNFNIPEILGDEWEIDDVINLAEKFGYFKYEKDIITLLENSEHVIFNGFKTFTIDGDWLEQVEELDREEALEHCIWHIELIEHDHTKKEFFFSLEEILNAKPIDENLDKWIIVDEYGNKHTIHFCN